MKTLLCSLTFAAAATLTVFAQGRVYFSNVEEWPNNPIAIGSVNMGTTGGLAGDGIGGDKYAVQLIWVVGTGYDQASFDAANPTYGSVCTGLGLSATPSRAFATNTGPVATGGGYFDAGTIPNPPGNSMPTFGWCTMQVLAWYNVGYSTYESARVGSVNIGRSQLFIINVSAPPGPAPRTVFPGFSVGTIPEPSTLALAGLGAAAMLLLRRKKGRGRALACTTEASTQSHENAFV